METLDFYSECSKKFNAGILRGAMATMNRYSEVLPLGWRQIIELQRAEDTEPYYRLDICSNEGAGAAAPAKMATLRRFNDHAYTGYASLEEFLEDLDCLHFKAEHPETFQEILDLPAMRQMPLSLHTKYTELSGLSAWHGGIRLPYSTLATEKKCEKIGDNLRIRTSRTKIETTTGEIRVAVSGGQEWQDTLLSFLIMRAVQKTMIKYGKHDRVAFVPILSEAGDVQVTFCATAVPLYYNNL